MKRAGPCTFQGSSAEGCSNLGSNGSSLESRPAASKPARLRETALYPAVKRFLEARGCEVKGEVAGCDVVGVQPGAGPRLVLAELKLSFTLELVLQAVDRLAAGDEVWLAVLATRRGRDRDRRVGRLCQALGVGLLAVAPGRGEAAVLAEPLPCPPRANPRARRRLLAEHAARTGDPMPGGSGGVPIMTAYRQRALACAALLRAGPGRPRDLRPAAPDAARILHRNVYGWFDRVERGVYRLSSTGEVAVAGGTATAGCFVMPA